MKKRLMLFGLSVVTILLAAVYSIAQEEEYEVKPTIFGKCLDNTDDACIAYCKGCGEKYGPIDTTEQVRVPISELKNWLAEKIAF